MHESGRGKHCQLLRVVHGRKWVPRTRFWACCLDCVGTRSG